MGIENQTRNFSAALTGRRVLFTPDKANRALVLVRRIVADIISQSRRLDDLQETLEAMQQGRYGLSESTREEVIEAIDTIESYVRELNDVGADLRDWTLGLVDFPCLADGREVCLCWSPEDETIKHWHDAGNECSGRKPIEMLPVD